MSDQTATPTGLAHLSTDLQRKVLVAIGKKESVCLSKDLSMKAWSDSERTSWLQSRMTHSPWTVKHAGDCLAAAMTEVNLPIARCLLKSDDTATPSTSCFQLLRDQADYWTRCNLWVTAIRCLGQEHLLVYPIANTLNCMLPSDFRQPISDNEFIQACKDDRPDALQFISSHAYSPGNDVKATGLLEAAQRCSVECIKWLLGKWTPDQGTCRQVIVSITACAARNSLTEEQATAVLRCVMTHHAFRTVLPSCLTVRNCQHDCSVLDAWCRDLELSPDANLEIARGCAARGMLEACTTYLSRISESEEKIQGLKVCCESAAKAGQVHVCAVLLHQLQFYHDLLGSSCDTRFLLDDAFATGNTELMHYILMQTPEGIHKGYTLLNLITQAARKQHAAAFRMLMESCASQEQQDVLMKTHVTSRDHHHQQQHVPEPSQHANHGQQGNRSYLTHVSISNLMQAWVLKADHATRLQLDLQHAARGGYSAVLKFLNTNNNFNHVDPLFCSPNGLDYVLASMHLTKHRLQVLQLLLQLPACGHLRQWLVEQKFVANRALSDDNLIENVLKSNKCFEPCRFSLAMMMQRYAKHDTEGRVQWFLQQAQQPQVQVQDVFGLMNSAALAPGSLCAFM